MHSDSMTTLCDTAQYKQKGPRLLLVLETGAMSDSDESRDADVTVTGTSAKSQSYSYQQRRNKTQAVRARMESMGGARNIVADPVMTVTRDNVDSMHGDEQAGGASSSSHGPAPAAEHPCPIVMWIKIDCDIGDIFAGQYQANSRFAVTQQLEDCYGVKLTSRGRVNTKSRKPRPTTLQLKGQREQVKAAYATLFELVLPNIRRQKFMATAEDAFRCFPLLDEDVALSRPSSNEEEAMTVSVGPCNTVDEDAVITIDNVQVRAHAIVRLVREMQPSISLQEHLSRDPWDAPMTVQVPPVRGAEARHEEFSEADKVAFRRACLLALERVKACGPES